MQMLLRTYVHRCNEQVKRQKLHACMHAMDMSSERRRGKQRDHIALWGPCVLLSSVSLLLLAAASSGLGPARLTASAGEISVVARRREAEGEGGGVGYCGCDHRMLVDGEWVLDERYPLYESRRCPFVDEGFRCRENGRPDATYAKWRWQPKQCRLPRFDAKKLLEMLRNRRVVFVGDSIGRNQWESLLCMLSSVVSDKSSIYEENGSPITKHKGFLSFRFSGYNCTVEHYRAPYLVRRGGRPRGAPRHVNSTLRLDAMDARWRRWKDADVLVFNTGHWWNHERLIAGGWYFQEGKKLRLDMDVESAYQRATRTMQSWVEKEINTSKTLVVFRTYSPAHARFLACRATNSRSCALEALPELNSSRISLQEWPGMLNPAFEASNKTTRFEVLNITLMTAQRRDGHPSVYNVGPPSRKAVQRADCSHWCLPGVPDAWNELLYAVVLRRFSQSAADV